MIQGFDVSNLVSPNGGKWSAPISPLSNLYKSNERVEINGTPLGNKRPSKFRYQLISHASREIESNNQKEIDKEFLKIK